MTSTIKKSVCRIENLDGEQLGYIESTEAGSFKITLEGRWRPLADALNESIAKQTFLTAPGRRFHKISGTSEEDLEALIHTLGILSERQLIIRHGE